MDHLPTTSQSKPGPPRSTNASQAKAAASAPSADDGAGQSPSSSSPLPSVPSVSVPKGGGAIRGMGDKFSTSPATGTCSLSIPLATSPGRGRLGAAIGLDYGSGAPNGPFGLGWGLSLPSISRKTDKGLPRYRDPASLGSDTFILSGAEDLVPVLSPAAGSPNAWSRPQPATRTVNGISYYVYAYRPRVEAGFVRIELWRNIQAPTTDIHWRTTSTDNVLSIYGLAPNSRIVDPADPTRIFRWLICQQHDRGNAVAINYKAEDSTGVPATTNERNRSDLSRSANRYIKNIHYGNLVSTLVQPDLSQAQWMFQVVFDYGEHDPLVPTPTEINPWICRNDPFSTNRPAFEVRTYRLCQRVLMFHNFPNEPSVGADCLVRSTNLTYRDDPRQGGQNITFLASASMAGYQRSGSGYVSTWVPALEFTYSEAVIDSQIRSVDLTSSENLPQGLDQSAYKWVDLDGEGVSGFLTQQGGSWLYKHNLGKAHFGPMQTLPSKPSLANIGQGQTQYLMDIAGEGRLGVVDLGTVHQGFSKRSFENSWEAFTPFISLPNINWKNPNLQMLDVTGDGLIDALIIEPDCLVTYASLGELGFMDAERWYPPDDLDEEKGPILIYADQKHTVFLADMTGDGLTDIVRISNGAVCYWANQGYGRFSPKMAMLQSPWFENPDVFDPLRIRLGDIDGSGTTDIVYLTANGFVDVYLNYSGNMYGPRNRLQAFPPVDNLATVTIVDLLGKGTGCLVWTSSLPADIYRRISYIDLVEGPKPNLLTSYINNMGAETKLTYAPSTKFYLQDKAAGLQWVTHLPFPMQVVERIETFDHISNSYFSTRYAYHHGYYDGIEREFRGFGRVDQWDTEEYNLSGPLPANIDKASWEPPVFTKTWFHTGAYFNGEQVSQLFKSEYYLEPGGLNETEESMLLPDSILPSTLGGNAYVLTYDEMRESVRSLKGSMLRQEVYALDGSSQEPDPFVVVEKNYTIQILQPQWPNLYGVFLPHERETVKFQYDRALVNVGGQQVTDPCVSHAMNLMVDAWGNVLQTLTIAYGRRHADPNPLLTSDDHAKQQSSLATLGVYQYTNAVQSMHAYRTPVLCDAQNFEIVNLPIKISHTVTQLVQFNVVYPTIQSLLPGNFDIPFEDWTSSTAAPAPQVSRRMLNHKRALYRKDDFTGPLPLGQLESLALEYDTYVQTFTPGLVQDIYVDSGKLVAGAAVELTLSNNCHLVHSEGDSNWWVRSGNSFYSPNSADTPAQESAYAAEHFYIVRRFRDPYYSATFDTETFAILDNYDLLVVENVDPFGNRVTAGERDATDPTKIVTLGNDYRVLAPVLVMDQNRNRTAIAYDDLGRLTAEAVMGKPEQTLGDNLSTVDLRLTDTEIADYFSNPLSNPGAVLGTATTRLIYDLFAYFNTKSLAAPQPVRTAKLERETHLSDLVPGTESKVQHHFSYLDSSLQEIQSVSQGELDPVTQGPRWIITGWTVFNNKGKPVQEFEPFFATSNQYEANATVGVSQFILYDSVGRVVAKLYPNHTWSKTVYSPWSQEIWDKNDTVLIGDPKTDTEVGSYFSRLPDAIYLPSWYNARIGGALGPQEAAAARKAAVHAATPSLAYSDPLGRAILSIAHNKYQRTGDPSPTEQFFASRVVFDISGATRQMLDANGRLIEISDVDMQGNIIHKANMDAGETWTLNSVNLKPVSTWDSRGFEVDTVYDLVQRPIETYLSQGTGQKALVVKTVYGDTEPGPEAQNLRTRVASISDQSGIKRLDSYDFKGNLLSGHQQCAESYSTVVDWTAASVPLEPGNYQISTTYDALNRVTTTTGPDGSIIRNTYSPANLLQEIDVNLQGNGTWVPVLANLGHNAKGQPVFQVTSKGIQTTYNYDPLTFELTNLVTSRNTRSFPNDCPKPPVSGWPGCQVQSLHYTYDPTGSIVHISDDAQQTIFFQNRRVEPSNDYTYDSLYRLIEAAGREHLGQAGIPTPYGPSTLGDVWIQSPSDGNAMGTYVESYFYDAVGNIKSVRHMSSDVTKPGWTRNYTYAEPSLLRAGDASNRLSSTGVGSRSENYGYVGNEGLMGNLTSIPHLSLMQWDYRNQLQATATQRVNSGIPETTWYSYDATGDRLRKLTVRQAATGANPSRKAERIYLGMFEMYREFAGNGTDITLERLSLNAMNGNQRVALIETRTEGTDSAPAQQFRYQYANQLGSALLELDDQGQILSYEEFYPFGSSSYSAVQSQTETSKRYRYNGKELDSENGFYYYGSRYYASWLGRWTNCDPSGLRDGPNPYVYVGNDPINKIDPNGKWKMDWKTAAITVGAGLLIAGAVVATAGWAAPLIVAAAADGSVVAGAVVAAAPVAETALTTYGLAETTRTAVGLATDVNPNTGRPYTDQEGTQAVAGLALTAAFSAVGIARSAGGKGPEALAAVKEGAKKLSAAAGSMAEDAEAALGPRLAPVGATAGGDAAAAEKPILAMADKGGGGGGSASASASAVARGEKPAEGVIIPKLWRPDPDKLVVLNKAGKIVVKNAAEIKAMAMKVDKVGLRSIGLEEDQIEGLFSGGPWRAKVNLGQGVETVSIAEMRATPGIGNLVEDVSRIPNSFPNIPGLKGMPDTRWFGTDPWDITTNLGVEWHDLRPLWSGKVGYFTYEALKF